VPSGRTNNYPESGRGLGHVTLTIFGSTVGYPSDSLASCLSLNSYIVLYCICRSISIARLHKRQRSECDTDIALIILSVCLFVCHSRYVLFQNGY